MISKSISDLRIPEDLQKRIKELPDYSKNRFLDSDPNLIFGIAGVIGMVSRAHYAVAIYCLYRTFPFLPIITGGKAKPCVGFKTMEPSETPLILIW